MLFAALASCNCGRSYTETADGVVVNICGKDGATKEVTLKVIDADIIRVIQAPEKGIEERASLVVLPEAAKATDFTVIEQENDVMLTTADLQVLVSKTSGAVRFLNLEGTPMLKEESTSFEAITVEGKQQYSFTQVFDSPADEAFYGLGQHQSDEWNYKGKNEELYQYNTKISIPFLVSNKNYGILWESYSLGRFGNPEDYAQMNETFKLYNKTGEEGGLTATYITAKGETYAERSEGVIAYESLKDLKQFPADFPFYNSDIIWEGEIEAPADGTYYFRLYYAGYTRVYAGGEEVVAERWRTAWNPNVYKFKLDLKAGERVPFKIDWRPDGGESYLGIRAMDARAVEEQEKLTLWTEMAPEVDYYFIKGDNMDEVISGYRQLTGKATIMPRWAYGFWQSRERYKTQDEVVGTLKEFRKRSIPIDNIVQDWSYWAQDSWGSHVMEESRFPNPQKMMDDIHDMNAHVMFSVWPKFYASTDNYKELDAKGYIYQRAIEDSIKDWIGTGYIGSFYDAYAPEAREIFWRQMKDNLYKYGVDAWWMDASEPDILSNADIDYRKALMTPTALGPSTEYFNTYSIVNADAIYNGQRGVSPDKRVFLLTRSGFAGLQRYATASWSGDIGTRWEDMKAQITAGMNFALSGVPYWTMDIGGFCVEKRYEMAKEGSEDLEEWRELNTRWYQFGTFAPLFRAHGQYPFREVFHIAPEKHQAYQSIVDYTKLRYRLMPYIYALGGQVYFDDYTIMRALVMDFGKDKAVENIDDQFMFGSALMICPVYEYRARSREVYLPIGQVWYDVHTGETYEGGQTIEAVAPYEQLPIFAKGGSILPVGEEIQYVGEKPNAPLKVIVYTGKDASFKLYEDEGVNYNYEKGQYSNIVFNWNEQVQTLTIGERKGSFAGMPETRIFEVLFVDAESKTTFNFDKLEGQKVTYTGQTLYVKK